MCIDVDSVHDDAESVNGDAGESEPPQAKKKKSYTPQIVLHKITFDELESQAVVIKNYLAEAREYSQTIKQIFPEILKSIENIMTENKNVSSSASILKLFVETQIEKIINNVIEICKEQCTTHETLKVCTELLTFHLDDFINYFFLDKKN